MVFSQSNKTILKLLILVMAFLGVSLFLGNNKAYALLCSNNGTLHDFAGLKVGFSSVDSNGNTINTTYSNVTLAVSTKNPSYSNSDASFNSNGTGYYNLYNPTNGSRAISANFHPKSGLSWCLGNDNGVLLTDDGTTDTNGKKWELDCDWSYRADPNGQMANPSNPFQEFYVQPLGVPDGLKSSGGWWELTTFEPGHDTSTINEDNTANATGSPSNPNPKVIVAPANGSNARLTFVYHQGANPPSGSGGAVGYCDSLSVTDDTYHYHNGVKYSTNTYVTVTDSAGNTLQNYHLGKGQTTSSSDTNFTPQSENVTFTIKRVFNDPTDYPSDNPSDPTTWPSYTKNDPPDPTGAGPCYTTLCTINPIATDLPYGYSSVGSSVTVTGTIYNVGLGIIPSSLGGHSFVVTNNGGDYSFSTGQLNGLPNGNAGSYPSEPFSFVINNVKPGTTHFVAQGAFANDFFMNPSGQFTCSGTITTYSPPVVSASATCNPLALNGWAYSPEYSDASIYVDVYIDGNYYTRQLAGDPTPTAPVSGNHGFNVTLPSSLQDGSNHTFTVVGEDPNGVQNGSTTTTMSGCRAYQYSPNPTASGNDEDPSTSPITFKEQTTLTFNPSSGAPSCVNGESEDYRIYKTDSSGNVTQLYVNWTYVGATPRCLPSEPTFNLYTLTVPPGSFQAGDRFCADVRINPGSGVADNSGNPVGPQGPAVTHTACVTVTNKPFFKVYGGSVSSGGDFSASSGGSCKGGGELAGWANTVYATNSPPYVWGSSTQLSALALLQITGVASAQTSYTRSPIELTFANAGSGVDTSGYNPGDTYSPVLGGNYENWAVYKRCLTDEVVGSPTPIGGSSTSLTGLNGAYSATGPFTINASTIGTDLSGKFNNVSLDVDGDVYIAGPITYLDNGSWSVGNVPSFVLHVKNGNIYIGPGVTQLDGIYTSVPVTTGGVTKGGTIFTCGTNGGGGFAAMDKAQLYNNCNNQLTVHGAFVARKVNLMRAYGSLRDEKATVTTIPASTTYLSPDGLYWQNSTTAPPNKTCTAITEPSDPYWRGQNYSLCVDNATGTNAQLKLFWTNNSTSLAAALSSARAANLSSPQCQNWFNISGERDNSSWQDDWLCYSAAIPSGYSPAMTLRFQMGTSGFDPAYCSNPVTNRSDFHAWPLWQGGAYVCETKVGKTTPSYTTLTLPYSLACSNAGARSSSRPTCAAEVFDFSPELYLANPAIQKNNASNGNWDSVTSLPPIL